MSSDPVPFCDLRAAYALRAEDVDAAVLRVARSGRYVLGAESEAFEHSFADACGVSGAVGVGSGTDALTLILRGLGVGPGDEVIVPAYTAAATWMAVAASGARPVGADVDVASGLIDPAAVEAAAGPRVAAVIAVHLFGRLAPMAALREVTGRLGLALIEDAAHAAAVQEGGLRAGSLGDAAAFSFYPTKPLGGLGDGGAVTSSDERLLDEVRRLRSYGWVSWQGDAERCGVNSRLDEIQAAVLRLRLASMADVHVRLRSLAALYRRALSSASELQLPQAPPAGEPPWHQFVLRVRRRDAFREVLRASGIGTAVHYQPLPHELTAFAGSAGRFPAAEQLAASAVSLPFDHWLTEVQADRVAGAVVSASGSSERSST